MNPATQLFTQIDQQLSAWLDAHRQEMIEKTQRLLQVPSVKGEPEPEAPFGAQTRVALDLALSFAQEYGFSIKNIDGYAGHAEWIPEGVAADSPIIGVLAHVDVVPAGDGWKRDPFGGAVEDGILYGRGAIDDKGPAMAALFAMIALKECGVPAARRLRMILGADEESGFGCVHRYFQTEEMPAAGFTPDGIFPLVYAEKGIANIVLACPAQPEGERIHVALFSGGLRPNMVPDYAEAELQINGPVGAIRARLEAVVGVSVEQVGETSLRVIAKGVAAHGSTPDEGVNAIVLLCEAMLLLDHTEDQVAMIQQIYIWGKDTTGAALGINANDPVTRPLTCNLGMAQLNQEMRLTFNVRYPVDWNAAILRERLETRLSNRAFRIAEITEQAPLHVPQDDPLVQTLLEVYRAETSDQTPAKTIGGGTYARAMSHGVAFGPDFPGTPGCAHQADEHWSLDQMTLAAKIYAKALARLANG